MTVIRLNQWGIALGSRDLGVEVRQKLLNEMELSDQPITVSFENIVMISSSFADECFGKLISVIGLGQFKGCFRVEGLHDNNIRLILNAAVNKRLNKQKQSV